jgi:tetratricopeptide (TPR) repeat protein
MSQPTPPNFKATILRQRLDQQRDRVNSNRFAFEEEAQLARQFREQAREIGDSDLELYALGTLGTLHLLSGKLGEAQSIYEEGVRIASATENVERLLNNQINLAVLHTRMRRYAEARALLENIVPTAEALPANRINVTRLYVTYSNLGIACRELGDVDAAERAARHLIDNWETDEIRLVNPPRRAELQCEAYDVLAWVYTMRGQYAEARREAQLLLDVSSREARSWLTSAGHLALLRLAIFDPDDHSDPELHWGRWEAMIAPALAQGDGGLLTVGSVDLLREARQYAERGQRHWAQRCAEKAVALLSALNAEQQRQFAQALLAGLREG